MMRYEPYEYQLHAEKHLFDNESAGLFMEMGLGKTVVTLSAVNQLMYGDMAIRKCLVIAPLKVAESVWTAERDKWDHLKHLRISLVLGSVQERLAALKVKADIYIINRENVAWLVTHYQSAWPFDMVIFDESSSFKNPASQRFKAIRMVLPKIARKVILTGTPSPNGLPDLWSQIYLLDGGTRLGKTVSFYREHYLKPTKMKDHVVYSYVVKDEETKQIIYSKIADLCISMKARDYLQLPERIERNYMVKLSKEVMDKYTEFEDTEVLSLLEEGHGEISAANAAALMNKLLQFSNGAIYKSEVNVAGKLTKDWAPVHDEKLNALGEIIEASQDEPILVFYQYKHDLERITAEFGGKKYRGDVDLKAWNAGAIPLLLAHPASVAYGLNMQAGGRIIVWYGVPWSYELWAQGNARLDRQGQLKPVIVHKIVCGDTVDMDTIKAIDRKGANQDALLNAVKARVDRVKTKYQIS